MTIALWCLFFAALLHFLSKIPLGKAQAEAGGYNNNTPREQQLALQGWGQRALAAHQNQIESFPIFAAGVLVASLFGANDQTVALLALVHCAARILFLVLYLKDIATVRSIMWIVSYFSSLALLCSPAWSA